MAKIYKVVVSKQWNLVTAYYGETAYGCEIKKEYSKHKLPQTVENFILREDVIPSENEWAIWFEPLPDDK